MYIKTEFLRNPITEYFRFLFNWYSNQMKYKNFSQSYMSYMHNSQVGKYVKVYPYAKVSHSKINSYTYIGTASKIQRSEIGKFCSIGQNCSIGLGKHPSSEYVSTSPIFYSTRNSLEVTFSDQDYFEELGNITIGNDVWIGNGVVIMDNIKIGDGAIIGTEAVVTKDVPDYAIYAGIPAKFIRYRFSETMINFLLKIKWWDKDEYWLKENFKSFHDVKNSIHNS